MTAKLILNTLAKEFSIKGPEVQAVLEMTDAGLHAPFIARVRRLKTGGLTESQLRRLLQRRTELDELDRRRGTILRQLEKQEGVTPASISAIETCSDRFELEDLFIPYRRPEPEVQLAMDRGLTALADQLVKSMPKAGRSEKAEATEGDDADDAQGGTPDDVVEAPAAEATVAETQPEEAAAEAPAEPVAEAPVAETEAAPEAATEEPIAEASIEVPAVEATAGEEPVAAKEAQAPAAEAAAVGTAAEGAVEGAVESAPVLDTSPAPHIHSTEALTLMCQPFVNPDRGIHSVEEALSGAVRILSDRLGRNAALRTTLRRMLRKRGIVEVHASVPMDKMGRHKALARFKSPLKQVQGHRLIALRQAQRERVLAVHL
ncbi:MAG: transcriptional accessory protein Tex/SPT6, partial [Planctomycetota bacterium]